MRWSTTPLNRPDQPASRQFALRIPEELAGLRVMVVDDAEVNRILLERVLRSSGHREVVCSPDGEDALRRWAADECDLVLLDLAMPKLDGYEVLERVQPLASVVPVIVLTADAGPSARVRALELGARDFLTKPFDRTEVVLRVRNHLHAALLQRRLQSRVAETRLELLRRLALAAELRDDDTHQHTERVGFLAHALALALGLDAEQADSIRTAAPLHDVGKIGTPDAILLKSEPLDAAERTVMQEHVAIGARILAGSTSPALRAAETIALTHHERWDGSGYPCGLSGEEIPLAGRIVAVADVFDALISERPYKPAWDVEDAIAEIERQAGRQFDPLVVAAFSGLARVGLLASRDALAPHVG